MVNFHHKPLNVYHRLKHIKTSSYNPVVPNLIISEVGKGTLMSTLWEKVH